MEVLRNDLGHAHEKVVDVTLDGQSIGGCNPNGGDYDCTFFPCSHITHSFTPTTEKVALRIDVQGHSWDCDCDMKAHPWKCSRENSISGRTAMTAVARYTFDPVLN